eukprot:TRINITY_DN3001_c0_g1_i16.p1 TRINITY_DN3001_c0_g1~~TRINITY_DN3001_c0_g1_i16.p1  ORF type:complete len:297 (+),score=93.61 TRINITY_DN3001_c0_g1_i16:648-1538(+)
MTLLCTAQGTNAQQDGSGAQRVYLHAVDGDNAVHRYWMEAERSKHKVGGEQKETEEEAKEAAARGKATSIHIGTRAMGTRFNVQMLIQVPLKQKEKPHPRATMTMSEVNKSVSENAAQLEDIVKLCEDMQSYAESICCELSQQSCQLDSLEQKSVPCGQALRGATKKVIGTSNAARVSRGTEYDVWNGVNNTEPERDPSQHATITVTLYYTVAGGIPSEADIEMCVKDLDELYKACPSDKKLVDCGEVTAELTVKDMIDINTKVTTQAYKPDEGSETTSKSAPASSETTAKYCVVQ